MSAFPDDTPERDPRRRFNAQERLSLFLAADGRCECTGCPACSPDGCGLELEPGWHADHLDPHSCGGRTELRNGAAKCPPCNMAKGATQLDDRAAAYEWQEDLVHQYLTADPSRYLVAAWTGLGKTRAGAKLSAALAQRISNLSHVVLCPTDDIARGWRKTLHAEGIHIKQIGKDQHDKTVAGKTCACGAPATALVMTYAFCAANPHLLLKAVRNASVVHLDETHHLRPSSTDRAWIAPLVLASPLMKRVICYSATPERTAGELVPWIHTRDAASSERDVLPDKWIYERSYGAALTAKEPRPVTQVVFERFDGDAEWWEEDDNGRRTDHKERISGDHGQARLRKVRRWALDRKGNWLREVLASASSKLLELSKERPQAAGIAIARDTNNAVAMADILTQQGQAPVFVYTDNYVTDAHRIGNGWPDDLGERQGHRPNLSDTLLTKFDEGGAPWIVSVRKLAEGIDVPRACVLVYATVVATWLAFIQAVGRILRTDWDLPRWVDQTGWAYILNDKTMSAYAAAIEMQEIDAILTEPGEDGGGGGGGGDGGGEQRRFSGFIASEADYAGATISGQMLDAELMALAGRVGLGGSELPALRKLWDAGILNISRTVFSASSEGTVTPPADPEAEKATLKEDKKEWVGKWAAARVRAGEFPGAGALGRAFKACNNELGERFEVWAGSPDTTLGQLQKAVQWAEEQATELKNRKR